MKYRYVIASILISCILVGITIARAYGKTPTILTINGLTMVRLVGLICINIVINETLLQPKLIVRDTLFETVRYRLALTGIGLVASLMIFDQPIEKLTGCFAVASICMDRDHRWSVLLALDLLVIVIVMLLLRQQGSADIYAVYLYYFLVITTVTKIVNNKGEESEVGETKND